MRRFGRPDPDPEHRSGAVRPGPGACPRSDCRVQQLHLLPKRIKRAVLNDADRRDTLTDNLGHFLVIQILNEPENDHLPLFLAEPENRLAYELLFGRLLIGPLRIAALFGINDAVVKLGRLALRAQVADAEVVGDVQQPGGSHAGRAGPPAT